jgi:hypothetical protein
MEDNIKKVERLRAIKAEMDVLSKEKLEIENSLPDLVIYKTEEEKPYIRFTKIDNIKELQEGRTVWKSAGVEKISTKIESLKHEPKEQKEGAK